MRRQALILAKNWNTPVSFWLSVTLPELREWITASNDVIKETEKKR